MSDRASEPERSRHEAEAGREVGGVQPALYACLYQPPLPRLLSVPPGVEADLSAGARAGIRAAAAPAAPVLRASAADGAVSSDASATLAGGQPGAPVVSPKAAVSAGERPVSPLVAVASEFSPRYEQHRLDLVSVDLRGLSRLFGSPRAIGAEIRRESAARGLRVHVAIAPTRTAALVLALTRPGLTVVPRGGVAGALADVPLTVLDQVYDEPPAGSRTRDERRVEDTRAMTALRGWGLRTLGELAALPGADLSARLGRSGRIWQAIARGDDTRPLVPMQADERFEGTMELEWPIEGQEPLSFVLTRMLEPLSTRLERRDRGVAVLHVALHLVTREVHQCRLELPSPLRDVRALRTLVLLDVEAHPPASAIDAVTITIEPTPGRILQHALFERPHPTPEQLSTLLARLGALMGQDRVGAPALVDSFRPGAFALDAFALEHRSGTGARAAIATSAGPAAGGRRQAGTMPAERMAGPVAGLAVNRTAGRTTVRASAQTTATSASRAAAWANDRATLHTSRVLETSLPLAASRLSEAGMAATSDAGPNTAWSDEVSGGDGRPMSALRRCRQPIPARVATDGHQRPLRVFTDRRGFAGGAVVSCAGPWRTSGAWWEDDERAPRVAEGSGLRVHSGGAADAVVSARQGAVVAGDGPGDLHAVAVRTPAGVSGGTARVQAGRREGGGRGPWSRDEWDVALADGAVYRIFRDRTTDGWFIDGVVD